MNRTMLKLIRRTKNYDVYQQTDGLKQKWYVPRDNNPAEYIELDQRDVPSPMLEDIKARG